VFQEEGRFMSEIERVANASMMITSAVLKHGCFGLILAQPRKIDSLRKGWNRFPNVDDVYGTGQIIKDAYCVTAGFRPLLVPGLAVRHPMLDQDGVMLQDGSVVHPNSYFLRMLICRKGELHRKMNQFTQKGEQLTLTNDKGVPGNEYITIN
jgi:hypothetical protein